MSLWTLSENRIVDMIDDLGTGRLALPSMQREYVWKRKDDIVTLVESLYEGYPVGAMYVWEAGQDSPVKPKRALKPSSSPPALWLIDGQQRLTSLRMAFGLDAEHADDHGGDVWVDLTPHRSKHPGKIFYRKSERDAKKRIANDDAAFIPLKRLWDARILGGGCNHHEMSKILDGIAGEDKPKAATILDKLTRIMSVQVPVTTIRTDDVKVAAEIFQRLNRRGRRLTNDELDAADMSVAHHEILADIRSFASSKLAKDFGFDFALCYRALVVFHTHKAKIRRGWMARSDERAIRESWDKAKGRIGQAIDFVGKHLGWIDKRMIPSRNAIIILAYAFEMDDPAINARPYLQWLCLTAMRGIFQGSVETTIDTFIGKIRDNRRRKPALCLLEALKAKHRSPLDPREFRERTELWGSISSVMFAYFHAQQGADFLRPSWGLRDLLRGDGRDAGVGLTVHHVFPRIHGKGIGMDQKDLNCAANYAFISQSTNSKFGHAPPHVVVEELTAPEQQKAGRIQFFSKANAGLMKSNDPTTFLDWRARELSQHINEWLGLS